MRCPKAIRPSIHPRKKSKIRLHLCVLCVIMASEYLTPCGEGGAYELFEG